MTGHNKHNGADRIAETINAAEEIADPLDGLVERCTADPGAAFTPEAIARLVELRKDSRPAFETLRAKLKKTGVRIGALDESIGKESGDTGGGRGPSQADVLTNIALAADLFHSPDETAYADVVVSDHRQTWAIRGKGFRRWLAQRFYMETGGAPNSEALQAALGMAEARAHFAGPERVVSVRVGGHDGKLYLDLGNETWQAVEIDANGWRVIADPPLRFRRSAGLLALPTPVPGGSITALRKYLNVKTDSDFVLAVSWLLAALRPGGPYPLIVLNGEEGSAKSSFVAILRALVDPNKAPLRALPREDRDLYIGATNAHVLAYDNLSSMPTWISDTLCRLATGGGFSVRALYTDSDESLFNACRPILLNGIEDIAARADLADRSLILMLEPISEEKRMPESDLWRAFEAERPRILGSLLDAMAEGLQRLPDVQLDRLPRLADFAKWSVACESALWPSGAFMRAYDGNRTAAVENVLDGDPVAAAVRGLMAKRPTWTGTATELLAALAGVAGEAVARTKDWPASPRLLGGRLRRAGSHLRKVGIEIVTERRARSRIITISTTSFSRPDSEGDSSSSASSSSSPNVSNGLAMTQTAPDDAKSSPAEPTVISKSLKRDADDADDGDDTKSRPLSGSVKKGAAGWPARI